MSLRSRLPLYHKSCLDCKWPHFEKCNGDEDEGCWGTAAWFWMIWRDIFKFRCFLWKTTFLHNLCCTKKQNFTFLINAEKRLLCRIHCLGNTWPDNRLDYRIEVFLFYSFARVQLAISYSDMRQVLQHDTAKNPTGRMQTSWLFRKRGGFDSKAIRRQNEPAVRAGLEPRSTTFKSDAIFTEPCCLLWATLPSW